MPGTQILEPSSSALQGVQEREAEARSRAGNPRAVPYACLPNTLMDTVRLVTTVTGGQSLMRGVSNHFHGPQISTSLDLHSDINPILPCPVSFPTVF